MEPYREDRGERRNNAATVLKKNPPAPAHSEQGILWRFVHCSLSKQQQHKQMKTKVKTKMKTEIKNQNRYQSRKISIYSSAQKLIENKQEIEISGDEMIVLAELLNGACPEREDFAHARHETARWGYGNG